MPESTVPSPPIFRRRRLRRSVAIAGVLATLIFAADSRAQQTLDISRPNPTGETLAKQELAQLLGKRLAGQPQSVVERAGQEFLDHLRQTSPIVAESFEAGRMSEDDLASRLDVFVGDHPEYTGRPARASEGGPRQRVILLLKDVQDLCRTDSERQAFADRFIERLGVQSGTSLNELMAGRMSQDELQSRVSVFVADQRAEAARVATDPAVAAALPIVDSYIKANFGSASDRMESICYRGTVEAKEKTREFVLFKKRPRLLRIHVVQDGLVVGVMGYDGTAAWVEGPGKLPVAAKGSEAEGLADASRFDDPLIGFRERGAEVRVQARPADGPIQLHIKESDGSEMVAAIDPTTYKEVSLRTRHLDGHWSEIRLSDYRKIGTVNFAFLQEEFIDGVPHSTTRIAALSVDPGLLESFFVRPAKLSFNYMDFMGALAVLQAREKKTALVVPPNTIRP